MASWSETLRAAASSKRMLHVTDTVFQTAVIDLINVDVTMEADTATRTFSEQRKLDVTARQAMLDEVERVINLIRKLRRVCEYFTQLNQSQATKCEQVQSHLEMIHETVTSILATIPSRYVPSTDEQGRDAEKLDDLGRLEAAVNRMVDALDKTEGQLRNAKMEVTAVAKEVARMREMADKMQKTTDEVASHLRDVVNEKDDQLPLLGLICTAQKLLEDETKAKSQADQALLPEKEKLDVLLDRRRKMLSILRLLFNRCADMDQVMDARGLRISIECPKEANEKQMAGELQRALSWLIEGAARTITELRSTRQRLVDSQANLDRCRRISEDGAEQMRKLQDTIHDLGHKLTDLHNKLADAAERKTGAQREADGMQAAFENEMARLEAIREEEKNRWQHLAREHDEKTKHMRQELLKLGQDVASLREQTTQLAIRVERALNEYTALKEKLEDGKSSLNQANRDKEAKIRKLCADLMAIEAEMKQVEREENEFVNEVSESRKEVVRRSELQDGAKGRFDNAKAQCENEERELARLKDEAARLQDKINSNEGEMKARNDSYRKLQENSDGLGQKMRLIEKDNNELRWAKNKLFTQGSKKERGPCPTCPTTTEVAEQLSALRREREQLEREKAELADREAELRQKIESKKDSAAMKPAVSSCEEKPVDFPSKERVTRIPIQSKPMAFTKQLTESSFKKAEVKEWLVEERTSVKQEADPSKPSAKEMRGRRASDESVPELVVAETEWAKPKRKASELRQEAVSKTEVRRVSSGVRRSKRSAMGRLEGKQLMRSDSAASASVATRTKSESTPEVEFEGKKRKVTMQINVDVVDEESGSECSSATAAEEGYDVDPEEGISA